MEIDAKSPDGNAFAIMGYVHKLLKEVGRRDEWPEIQKQMMSGNYDNLCAIAEQVSYGAIVVVNRSEEEG